MRDYADHRHVPQPIVNGNPAEKPMLAARTPILKHGGAQTGHSTAQCRLRPNRSSLATSPQTQSATPMPPQTHNCNASGAPEREGEEALLTLPTLEPVGPPAVAAGPAADGKAAAAGPAMRRQQRLPSSK